MTIEVGDRVKITFLEGIDDKYFSVGAEGVVIYFSGPLPIVRFDKGLVRIEDGEGCWAVSPRQVEVVT